MRALFLTFLMILGGLASASPRHFHNNENVEIVPIEIIDYDPHESMYQEYEQVAGITRRSGKVFVFDPRNKSWQAYNNGRLVKTGRASGGKGYCHDVRRSCRTPVGSFRVYRKGSAHCRSSKYPIGRGGAPMPYCMFFRGGYAIHGSPDVPDFNASHGCIRVVPAAARWLHQNFIDHGTTVIVRPY